MKLEFLANRIDGVGYHPDFSEHLLVLSDFTREEAGLFRDALIRELLPAQKPLDLSGQYYIELVNCNLLMRLSDEDEGIRTRDSQLLYCDLTPAKYQEMILLLQPFCEKEKRGYTFLSEEGDIDFLLSPGKSL
ncbi:MAG TPA: hypothetical protein VNZ86_07845 [Bacteroidia bacterium]|jgi:hypothetical protein|nr:hypothetical protein [Bacteroidia bacterium]